MLFVTASVAIRWSVSEIELIRKRVGLRMWRIAYPNFYMGLLFTGREDDSILKIELHFKKSMKLYLFIQDSHITWPDLYPKRAPWAPCPLHRLDRLY